MQAGERDLGGADQVEVVVGRGVDRGAVGGEEARAHMPPPAPARGHDRREPRGLDQVERQRHQRELHAHQRAEQVGEAAPDTRAAASRSRAPAAPASSTWSRGATEAGGSPASTSTASSSPPSGASSSARFGSDISNSSRSASSSRSSASMAASSSPSRRASASSGSLPRPSRRAWPTALLMRARSARADSTRARRAGGLVQLQQALPTSPPAPRRARLAATRSGSERISFRSSRPVPSGRGGVRALCQAGGDRLEIVPEHEGAPQPGDLEDPPQAPVGADQPSWPWPARARFSRLTSAPRPDEVEQRHVGQVDDQRRGGGVERLEVLAEAPPCRCRARPRG